MNQPNAHRAAEAAKHYDENKWRLTPSAFRYTDFESSELLYSLPVNHGWLHVIGEPDNASYEWVYMDEKNLEHSNAGWGGCDVAMLAGLKAMLED